MGTSKKQGTTKSSNSSDRIINSGCSSSFSSRGSNRITSKVKRPKLGDDPNDKPTTYAKPLKRMKRAKPRKSKLVMPHDYPTDASSNKNDSESVCSITPPQQLKKKQH